MESCHFIILILLLKKGPRKSTCLFSNVYQRFLIGYFFNNSAGEMSMEKIRNFNLLHWSKNFFMKVNENNIFSSSFSTLRAEKKNCNGYTTTTHIPTFQK